MRVPLVPARVKLQNRARPSITKCRQTIIGVLHRTTNVASKLAQRRAGFQVKAVE
jgi:hypothetical protein